MRSRILVRMITLRARARRLWQALSVTVLVGLLAACASSSVDLAKLEHYTPINGKPLGPASGQVTQLDGSQWRYAAPAADKITLLYFGYTSCPDVCPSTIADVAFALQKLPSETRDKVWVQFVSTDPDRDTPEQMRAWLGGFDPSFHGGRAPMDQVIADAKTYGVGIEAPEKKNGDYQVTHGAMLVVLNPKGEAVGYFTELAGHQSYMDAIPALVKKYA